jgi:hypothetical protein
MTDYKFQTDKFALSEKSVHYLRGPFNYDTVDYMLIDEFIVDKGAQINNWPIALIIGVSLIISPLMLFLYATKSGESHNIGMSVELGILPFLFGISATYQALRRGHVLIIKYNGKTVRLPFQSLKKTKQIDPLIDFLRTNKQTRSKTTVSTH